MNEMITVVMALVNSGALIYAFKYNSTKEELKETKEELKQAREDRQKIIEQNEKLIQAISNIKENVCKLY